MFIARNLVKIIDKQKIWSGITLKLKAGDRLSLRGPSGSGKTVLMRTLVGLETIDEGEIVYRNRSLAQWHIPEYRRLVRYIPQDATFISGTVRDSITLFFSFKANRDLHLDESVLKLCLDILQLPESFMDKTADHLSGGEKQIVALLRSLLLEPEVLLLDEPTSNLDEDMVGRVENLINNWMSSDANRFLIWTSHDSRQLDRMTCHSLKLNNSNAL